MQKVGNRKVKAAYYNNSYEGNYKRALERDSYRCVDCGSQEYIIVHHKDFDRSHNDLDNLETLCKPCHAKAHGQNLRFSNPNLELITELRQNDLTFTAIAKYLGISRQRVHQIVARVRDSGRLIGGEKETRLAETRQRRYEQIRRERKAGAEIWELMAKYHMGRDTIYDILDKKRA